MLTSQDQGQQNGPRKSHDSSLLMHALNLQVMGIGPTSRMCRESLLLSDAGNVDLPAEHATEGAKFAALARRIAPARLVAAHIQRNVAVYPMIGRLNAEIIETSFTSILMTTENICPHAPRGQEHTELRHTAADCYNYFDYTTKNPNIYLACIYLSVALQQYVFDLAEYVSDPEIGDEIKVFGAHFNASNLVSMLPMALCRSLIKLHGSDAAPRQIDSAVIQDALTNMHDSKQFEIRATGREETNAAGIAAVFRCPMEGYLVELLGHNEVLQPLIAAIDRLDSAIATIETSPPTRPDEIRFLALHYANGVSVTRFTRAILDRLDRVSPRV